MNKKTSDTKLKTFLLILAAIAFYAVALSVINFLVLPYTGIIHLLLILAVAVSVYVFMRYNLYVYDCTVNDGEIIFTSRLGEAEKLIAKVAFDKISFIAPAGSEIAKNTKEIYRYNAKNSFSGKDAYVLIFSDEKKRISKLTFKASEEILEELSACGIKVM